MNSGDTEVKDCLFALFPDCYVDLLLDLFYQLLDPGRVYPAVVDKAFKCNSGDLTPHRIMGGKRYEFVSVINYNIDPSSGFKCPDISTFPADYSSLHLIIGKAYRRNRCIHNIITGIPLYRKAYDLFSFFLRRFLGLILDLLG